MIKKLYFFVENFSNQSRESFFEKELPYLEKRFDKIYVVPLYPDETELNFKSEKIDVIDFNYFAPVNRIHLFISNLSAIIKVFCFEFLRTHRKLFYILNFKKKLNELIFKFSAAQRLEAVISKDINENTVFYTYWFMQWTLSLSILKLKYSSLKLVSRVHGADYDEDQIKTVLPFRYFQLDKVDLIFPVSEYASTYLKNKFMINTDKIFTAHLGLPFKNVLSPIRADELLIVSCSSVIPIKRVHLIIGILKHININVKWVHFGDGPLLNGIKNRAALLPANVKVDFKGYVANNVFLSYLKTNPVSIFINVSESEGIPVTFMEAISCGIPIMGTNVCGVPEIVTPCTGILISVDFNIKDIAQIIEAEHLKKNIYSQSFRNSIREFYNLHFSADKNYSLLSEKLYSFCNN